MANALYSLAKQKFLSGAIDWVSNDIRAVLVDLADYTPNLVTDEFLSSIAPAAQVADMTTSMTSKVAPLGVADADDVTYPSVSGDVSEAIAIYQFVTNDADSPLIALIDTATGLPVTPDGNDINILWDNGVNRIFAF